MESYNDEISDDQGLADRLRAMVPNIETLTSPVPQIEFSPQELYENAIANLSRRRKNIAKVGALGLSFLGAGFAARAVLAHRSH